MYAAFENRESVDVSPSDVSVYIKNPEGLFQTIKASDYGINDYGIRYKSLSQPITKSQFDEFHSMGKHILIKIKEAQQKIDAEELKGLLNL